MTKQDALNLLHKAISSMRLTLEDHKLLQQALMVLSEKDKPEVKEDGNISKT
jgi:hypothetical protein